MPPKLAGVTASTGVDKARLEKQVGKLRRQLLDAQRAIVEAGIPVLLIVSGHEGAGKSSAINRLSAWLDPRLLRVHSLTQASDEESQRPVFWRYWKLMPARGEMALLYGSWYDKPLAERMLNKLDDAHFQRALQQIQLHEHLLAADGVCLLKLWLQLSEQSQQRRIQELRERGLPSWQLAVGKGVQLEDYDAYLSYAQQAVDVTHHSATPWQVICAEDELQRDVEIGKAVLARLRASLKKPPQPSRLLPPAVANRPALDKEAWLPRLSKTAYREQLSDLQAELARLVWQCYNRKHSLVLVFEGWDAAGKGGSIRRITQAVDARLHTTIATGKPSDEELAHHYLWRFWRHLPRDGRVTLYDRSWYGRVLVERVEKLTPPSRWQEAYSEIRLFEDQLADHGVIVLKFWLHISAEEQEKRLKAREKTAHKQHKIEADDWRNLEMRDAYTQAVDDMLRFTDQAQAPWHVVASDNKRRARIEVLSVICDRLRRAVD